MSVSGSPGPELVCPAGTPSALRAAVDAGAGAVYCGFRNATNARNFPGLNFTNEELKSSISYAHDRGTRVLVAINTFPPAGKSDLWRRAIDDAVELNADAAIVADIGVAEYASTQHPGFRLHLSVQAGAPSVEAVRFYCEEFGVKRVVLPRILTIPEIKALKAEVDCEVECFVFGNHGLMAEGRCSLTNYVTGLSTNMDGVCSPANRVSFVENDDGSLTSRLGEYTIDKYEQNQNPGYPTICKGRYSCSVQPLGYHAFEEPVTLNLAALLAELIDAGVDAFKIEGRQRSSAYVKNVVSTWSSAIEAVRRGDDVDVGGLLALSEGHKETTGAYATKRWR